MSKSCSLSLLLPLCMLAMQFAVSAGATDPPPPPPGGSPGILSVGSGSGLHQQPLHQQQQYNILVINSSCPQERFSFAEVLASMEEAAAMILMQNYDGGPEFVINVKDAVNGDVDAVLDGMHEHPPELAVVHPGCSNNTAFLADICRYFNSTLVTYAFSSVPYVPRANHLRLVPSEEYMARGALALLKQFDWGRLVVLSENAPIFSSIVSSLQTLKPADVNVTEITVLLDALQEQVLFPNDSRIFLLNSFPEVASAILCEGWKRGKRSPFTYVWLLYEWSETEWWAEDTRRSGCGPEQLKEMLEHSLVLSLYQLPGNLQELKSNYERHASDAIWTLSALVNDSTDGVRDTSALELNFNGPVSFQDGVPQIESLTIKQYQMVNGKLKLVPIGRQQTTSHKLGDFTYHPGEGDATVWGHHGGRPPPDGSPVLIVNPPLLPLMVLVYIYATAGILFALVCLVFNIVFRDKKFIRLTSPNLNYIIILGAIVFYSSAFSFFHAEGTSVTLQNVVCNVRLWLVSLGFSLCYGPINAKMWRVYHICHKPNPSMKKLFVKDWHLALVVLGFVAADVILLTVVTAWDGVRYSVHTVPDLERSDTINEEGIREIPQVQRCFSDTEYIWLSINIIYKIIIQVIGAFLAFNIRKVKIKGLNDSKEISAILYVTTILTIVIVLVNFVFGDYVNVDGGVYGFGISTATTCVLGFIFVPKMVTLYRDPKGDKIFSTGNRHDTAGQSQSGGDKVVISAMERRISELELQIQEMKESTDTKISMT